ncbi:MAG: c-type cytochrome [Burkholderiales bacterium]|nr:MAG: c-type cytochrome [Burkholderiales bacterium]
MTRIGWSLLAAIGWSAPALAQEAPGDGRALYEQHCAGCHAIDANRVGPAHRGVFGRKAGLAPGFRYSDAVKRSGVVWDAKSLDAWLADPERLIPGQKMYAEFEDPAVRRAIIEFLRTQR